MRSSPARSGFLLVCVRPSPLVPTGSTQAFTHFLASNSLQPSSFVFENRRLYRSAYLASQGPRGMIPEVLTCTCTLMRLSSPASKFETRDEGSLVPNPA